MDWATLATIIVVVIFIAIVGAVAYWLWR